VEELSVVIWGYHLSFQVQEVLSSDLAWQTVALSEAVSWVFPVSSLRLA